MSKIATPTPWKLDEDVGGEGVLGPDEVLVADCSIFVNPKFGERSSSTNRANAALIVEAVNERSNLIEALETALRVAAEARTEWDAAPQGMKAGKLLIALSDPTLKYRADISKMHKVLKKAKAS